ncbi:unnamed protein product [Pleuronectes platessa]|uniref:Uncharacterized protein n=1 Tax=Pleuronectes platessa TaxID=8262 RepID=A0A9N7VXV7_PLEPL|nr:unnamed protein product [Pleuronectes platessa]
MTPRQPAGRRRRGRRDPGTDTSTLLHSSKPGEAHRAAAELCASSASCSRSSVCLSRHLARSLCARVSSSSLLTSSSVFDSFSRSDNSTVQNPNSSRYLRPRPRPRRAEKSPAASHRSTVPPDGVSPSSPTLGVSICEPGEELVLLLVSLLLGGGVWARKEVFAVVVRNRFT